jgi:hypothetical protein
VADQRYHRFSGIHVGNESKSGLAVSATIGGEHYWVPLSVVHSISRDQRSRDNDELVVHEWWARKNSLIP